MDTLQAIPWNLIMPIIVLQLVLMVAALISLAKAEYTKGPKWLWVILIIGLSIIGSVAYFIIGRRDRG
ncbi:PLDc N-terminal domain-containing protein [Paenibacillus sp. 1001270B_150601_E10]|uniref:PLDc N-terminal domain-containing protein n=1 Tax=Paenibacillus sp. 1001270B_150601_E10 TaxID=2787079 RepID=UPI00189D63F5|nr:PLDc N-terminal domain-containing protein [Paenibacillus sp. 1001270B_150601_E10]